jgi:hypothetical protein
METKIIAAIVLAAILSIGEIGFMSMELQQTANGAGICNICPRCLTGPHGCTFHPHGNGDNGRNDNGNSHPNVGDPRGGNANSG